MSNRTCSDCAKPLASRFKPTSTGRCVSCLNKVRGKDSAFQARRVAGIHAKFQDPSHKAKMTRTILSNAATARQNPDYAQRLVEHGKWVAEHVLKRPDVVAKSKAARSRAGRTLSETRMAWCPEQYRDRYRFLTKSKRMLAADAKAVILAGLTPFERQLHAIRNGAKLVDKPVFRSRPHDFTLGGVSDLGI